MSPSESTNLTRDDGLARTNTYFASPELSQRADLLRHLTENSNLIPLVRGAEGMGKTTFIRHLLDLAPENWIPVEISADVMMQPDALLADLADLFDQDDSSDRLMDDLIGHFDDLRQDGFLPVIIIDDAHLLPEASIITLLRLHERGHDDVPLAQILLFAEPEIDDLLRTPQLRVMNLQSLQLLDMPEFTLEQTELYLEHLLSAEGSSSVRPLTDSQIEKIYEETGGAPGLIKEQALKLAAANKKPALTINLHEYLSKKSIIGGGVAAVIVVLILIYQSDINAIFTGENKPAATNQEEHPPAVGSVSLPIPEFVDGADQDLERDVEESVNRDVPSDMETVEGEEMEQGSVSDEGENKKGTESQEQAPQLEAVKVQAAPKPVPLQSVQDENQPEKEDDVAGSSVKENIEQSKEVPINSADKEEPIKKEEPKVSKNIPAKKPATSVKPQKVEQKGPNVTNNKPKAQVQQARKPEKIIESKEKTLPVKTDEKVPAPAINESPKSVQAPPPSPQKKGVPTPAPVEDRSTMLVQKEVPAIKATGSPPSVTEKKTAVTPMKAKPAATAPMTASSGFLREDWLLKQKPSSYTIQIVGLQDEKGIAEFIKRHSISGHIAYYRTQRGGKPWFSVLYGAYSTRGRAVEARNKLPESLIKSGVWLRTLSSVQKDIRAR